MAHNHTDFLGHGWHFSSEDIKKTLSSYFKLLENMAEKTVEAGIIIAAAGLIYKVIQIFYASNIACQSYAHGLQCLNVAHQFYSYALQGFF